LLSGAVLVLVVLVGAGAVLIGVVAREPVAAAADDLAGWQGVKYRGTYTDASGVTTAVALTVAADGHAYGTFERPSGARAQLVVSGPGSRVKGNREWWRSVAVGDPDARADLWVEIPPGERSGLPRVEQLTPASLGHDLTSSVDDTWRRTGERVVDGRSGEIWSNGAREVVIGADAQRPVLALAFPIAWWSAVLPSVVDAQTRPSDDPRAESNALQEATVQLSLAESDDGEMEALEELVGNLQELVDQAKAVVEQDQEQNEKTPHDRQTVDC
jgi:hypothetical protein